MPGRLKKRSLVPEFMDDFSQGGDSLREALKHLRRLNRLFAAAGPTLYGVERLWREAGCPAALSLLDIGAGSGDINQRLLRWADKHGIQLRILLMDITEEACTEARLLYKGEPRVEVVQGDVFALKTACADVVTASQFLHHFSPEEVPAVVRHLLGAARYGVVINDIHRHPVAWGAVWLATRLLSRNRYIRHDGPLSVAKGFRSGDWKELQVTLGFHTQLHYTWRPLFRYAVTARRVEL
ncbi:methyltransferase domain-containing protein [Paenibacillus silviterrae]|uniref:methyltransferase domain-containing protein n=1 Tax=Paenibacillus silviterrae TaxID=3242194 RepID=UPI002543BF5A|nr:methyltransferase domain-containing protein [Paenibacillus chinjuensis]